MPIAIQEKGSGLYVARGGGFTTTREEVATFESVEQAEECRRATLKSLGETQTRWDLRVVGGPDVP